MKVTRDKTENSQVFLTIEMEPAEVEESLEKSYRRLVKRANIPGFRKGKAPRDILERHMGKERIFEDALNALLPQAYEKAIDEQQIEAIAQPHVEVAEIDPVIFKVTVPLPPTIELGDYRHIQVEQKPAELTEDDIDSAIEQLRHQHASWEPVERSADFGDLVVLDVESNVDSESILNQKGVQYPVLRDSSYPAPGFADQIAGMNADEVKEFELRFPPDYPKSELAGKAPTFKVKINEIKQENLPELNDDFARRVGPEFETIDSLREQVASRLKLRAEEMAKADYEERVVETVVDLTQLEFPPIFVEAEIDRLLRDQMRQNQMSDHDLEEYLKTANKTSEELREEFRPTATRKVTQSLVLGKVIEKEKLEVSDTDIDTEIENIIKSTSEKKDEMKKLLSGEQARQSIRQSLVVRKTVQRLVEIAKGSNTNNQAVQEEKNE